MKAELKSVKVWDIFVRIFHWSLVGTVLALYLSGDESESVHSRFGYFVICLVLARIVWGFIGTKHARFSDFLYGPGKISDYLKSLIKGNPTHYLGHNPAGGIMIIVMLLCLLITAFAGLKTIGSEGKGRLAETGNWIVRAAYADEDEGDGQTYSDGQGQRKEKDEFWEDIHELLTSFVIFLIIVHVVGVIVSSWVHKENLILGMITGRKIKE